MSWPLEMPARGKINWNLDITGQREDGYHLLDSLMQPIVLCDWLYFKADDDLSLEIGGMQDLPADENNLVLKAANALRQYSGIDKGAKIYLEKSIPTGAGLGGGSADAAAALRGLCHLWDLEIDEEELMQIGLSIGADVPFCLMDEPCRAQGIGEILTPVSCKKAFPLILIQPCAPLSTRDVFTAFHQSGARASDMDACIKALSDGDLSLMNENAENALESASIPMRPEIAQAREALFAHGAAVSRMTGSGSVVFGAFENEKTARRAWQALRKQYDVCLLTATAL